MVSKLPIVECTIAKDVSVTVESAIGSLKVPVMAHMSSTLAPFVGSTLVTVGALVSGGTAGSSMPPPQAEINKADRIKIKICLEVFTILSLIV